MDTVRFWHYGRDNVRITLRKGQTLHHSYAYTTDEGWSSESNIWSFDGEVVTCQWCNDGRDCDGRLTSVGESYFLAKDAKAGYQDADSIAYPKWEQGESSQRDEYAEAVAF